MILKYVLTSFGRRKVRTILMILSLMVSTGLIVTMSATVETIRRSNIDLIATMAALTGVELEEDQGRDSVNVMEALTGHPEEPLTHPAPWWHRGTLAL